MYTTLDHTHTLSPTFVNFLTLVVVAVMDAEAATELVERIYSAPGLDLDAAFDLSEADIKLVNNRAGSNKAVNYGEMCLPSWATVVQHVGLSSADVFYDLGSGRGTLVLHTQLMHRLQKCVGVELSAERHSMASRALQALRQQQPQSAAAVTFLHADIRECDLSDATCCFLMNQDMPHKLIAAVWTKLLAIEQPCTVITLHAPRDIRAADLPPRETLSGLPQTWNAAVDVLVYRLPGAAACRKRVF